MNDETTPNEQEASAHLNLGLMLVRKGLAAEGLEHLGQALELWPDHADALNDIATVLQGKGLLDEAAAYYRRILAVRPDYARGCNNLGTVLKDLGRTDEAVACFERAIALEPAYALAYGNLGAALEQRGETDAALLNFYTALELEPDDGGTLYRIALLLHGKGALAEALACYLRSLACAADNVPLLNNLAGLYGQLGEPERTLDCYQRALGLDPGNAGIYLSRGNFHRDRGDFEEAVIDLRQALELDPTCQQALINLANILKNQGKVAEALACCRRAREFPAEQELAWNNLLYIMQYLEEVTPEEIFAEHLRWGEVFARPLASAIRPFANEAGASRRVRIGYVSPDFRSHSVSYLFEPVLACHDHRSFEIFCYASVSHPDAVTARLRGLADQWRDIAGLSDDEAAQLVRNDRIDILVDLAGHTGGNRLLLFARKPAPIQVGWLGYWNTTGLDTIDYVVSDPVTSPDDSQLFTETVERMPFSRFCYDPGPDTPACALPPMLDNGFVTFGCFNNLAKLNKSVVRVWAKLLQSLPGSRLLVKSVNLDDDSVRNHYRDMFREQGIGDERVSYLGRSSRLEMLQQYALMDIALDPFPFPGGLTTCEALWMGVPVVAMEGRAFIARQAASLLTTIGHPEWLAGAEEEYIAVAARLAADRARLVELRRTLRGEMLRSPLMDAPRFTADLEALYHRIWRRWCGGAR